MKTAIYCRVSTETQEREGASLLTQTQACLAKANEAVPEELRFIEALNQEATKTDYYLAELASIDKRLIEADK